ncbi:CRE-MEX-3 protein [Aphelenchoides avenae]|nr:CRE-MEX-3 protein [Aphelenchus avenae]KAH7720172.1 CRE-MEX-3 protein [Aphelenchus avenae]
MAEVTEIVEVNSSDEVAYVVGTKGSNVIEIQNETKTTITSSKKGSLKNQFTVVGPADGVRRAKQLIQQQLDFLRKKEHDRVKWEEDRKKKDNEVTLSKEVPLDLVGAIIGTKGETIRHIQESTNTHIKSPLKGDPPFFEITGQPADVEAAKEQILAICNAYSTKSTYTNSDAAADNWGSTTSDPWHVDQHKASVAANSQKLPSATLGDTSDARKQLQERKIENEQLKKRVEQTRNFITESGLDEAFIDIENEQLKKSLERMRNLIKETGLNDAFIEFMLKPSASNP